MSPPNPTITPPRSVDPAAVSNPAELARLSRDEKVEFARLYPEAYEAAAGRPAPMIGGPLTPEEAKTRAEGLTRLAETETKRIANVTSYADFQKLPTALQMRLATQDPAKYSTLSADLRNRLARSRV